jgi:hypothetical protein
MKRLVITARLLPGRHEEAEALLRGGPPFEPQEIGLHRHAAYLSANEVVFVFEAPEVEWVVADLGDDPVLSAAFAPWRLLLEEPPRVAQERYFWSREHALEDVSVGLGI